MAEQKFSRIKKHLALVIALCFYTTLAAYLFKFFRFYLNPDGVSYISIAQKYLAGHFEQAVNGHWSPLLSWLMIPFIFSGTDSLVASKLVILLSGGAAVIGVYLLAQRLALKKTIKFLFPVILAPFILKFAYHAITPDILTVAILLFYLALISGDSYLKKRSKTPVIIGALGALAFLAKAYNFYFFLAHFILVNIIYIFPVRNNPSKKRIILRNLTRGLLVFLAISGVWIAVISFKYNRPLISTAIRYNLAILKPGSNSLEQHPFNYSGFTAPKDQYSISSWDDPSYYELAAWNFFESKENFVHELKLIKRNLLYFPVIVLIEFAAVFFLTLFFIARSYKKEPLKHQAEIPVFTAAYLYPAGYLLLLIYERYVWLSIVLIIMLAGFCLTKLMSAKFSSSAARAVILSGFTALILASPVKYFRDPAHKYEYRDIYGLASALKQFKIQGRLASNKDTGQNSLFLAYYLDSQYFGPSNENMEDNPGLLHEKLKEFNIDYYLVWGKTEFEFLKTCPEVTAQSLEGFKAYDLRKIK
ncbi:hypothetical protein KJ912_01710 [Patescibacteria group bacterium]|nr:hypothetical protein [Patescibacteria group bacterium]